MFRMRKIAFLKLSKGLMSPRLLAGSVNKGDSSKESCKDDSKNKEKKKKTDICGRSRLPISTFYQANTLFFYKDVYPTSPRCKNKPKGSDKKSGDECKK